MNRFALKLLLLFWLVSLAGFAHAERIKDVASVDGVRVNQLVGYGLVVGSTLR